jgi:hypothetical protein
MMIQGQGKLKGYRVHVYAYGSVPNTYKVVFVKGFQNFRDDGDEAAPLHPTAIIDMGEEPPSIRWRLAPDTENIELKDYEEECVRAIEEYCNSRQGE